MSARFESISALICTRNGARTLGRTLSACERSLSRANLPLAEIIVVDNESTDATRAIVHEFTTVSRITVRLLSASPPGKTKAFCVGVRSASGNLVSIIDDDNYVDELFFETVSDFFSCHPDVGMVASANRLAEGVPTPDWFPGVSATMYACGDPVMAGEVEARAGGGVIASQSMPAGAGLTFRRDVLIDAMDGGFRFFNDTERSKRLAGEDTEMCMLFWSLGWRFGFDPRIRLEHDIDPARLTRQRHRDLAFAQGAGGVSVTAFLHSCYVPDGRIPMRWRWWWQALRAAKALMRASVAAPVGARVAIGRGVAVPGGPAHAWGALCRLLRSRREYDRYVRQISSAPWAARRVR